MKNIILASASPRRKELLKQIGVDFDILTSDVEENISMIGMEPYSVACKLATEKAEDVARKVNSGLIIGADTIVVVDGEIFGKPVNGEEAQMMLKKLSGREHNVITGVALIDAQTNFKRVSYEVTKVLFDTLSLKDITDYIQSKEPFGKAGAYAIQGLGGIFIRRIEGCYFNVVGLPLNLLRNLFQEMNKELK